MSLQKKYKQEMVNIRNHIAKYGVPVDQQSDDIVDHIKKMTFDKLVQLLESPYNIGYNERNEFATIYKPSFKKIIVGNIAVGKKQCLVFFSKEAEAFFVFAENNLLQCIADLQINYNKQKEYHIVFSWQEPTEKGVVRELLKFLVTENVASCVVSGPAQSENAFEMWKKLADDTDVCVGIYGEPALNCLSSGDLKNYFGNDVKLSEKRFVLTKNI